MQVLEIKQKNVKFFVKTIIFKPSHTFLFRIYNGIKVLQLCYIVGKVLGGWVGVVFFDSFLVKRNLGAISPSILSFVSVI